jgi:uncharacterized protein YecE (DUF72 family)
MRSGTCTDSALSPLVRRESSLAVSVIQRISCRNGRPGSLAKNSTLGRRRHDIDEARSCNLAAVRGGVLRPSVRLGLRLSSFTRAALSILPVTVFIGTSGWHYPHWRPRFYPAKLSTPKWLSFYSERFATVEVNNAFYRLPEKETFAKWRDETPDDFVVAVKVSRYITHVRRLRDSAEPVSLFMERATALGSRLGPILLQLPPNLRCDPAGLEATLSAFGGQARIAVEARHSSWFHEEVRAVLESHGGALCLADGGPVDVPLWRTADWSYVRFHQGRGRPAPCYTRSALDPWAEKIVSTWKSSEDVFCYFNNDTNGCALRDARWFAQACARLGRAVTRVPAAHDTKVG